MLQELKERTPGSFAWRFNQLRLQWGLTQEDLGKAFGKGLKKTVVTKISQDGYWEDAPEKDKLRYISRLRGKLPTVFVEYLLHGGNDAPPVGPEDFDIRNVQEQAEMGRVFNDINDPDRFRRAESARTPVSPRQLIREIMADFNLNVRDATAYALLELAGQGRGDLVNLFDKYFEQSGSDPVAAEEREAYIRKPKPEALAANGNALTGGQNDEAGDGVDADQKKVANGAG